jgi:hypothetical protein
MAAKVETLMKTLAEREAEIQRLSAEQKQAQTAVSAAELKAAAAAAEADAFRRAAEDQEEVRHLDSDCIERAPLLSSRCPIFPARQLMFFSRPAYHQMAMRKIASDVVDECMQAALMRLHGEPQASVPLTPVAAVASSALTLTARVRRVRSQLASFTEGGQAAASPLPLKSFSTPAAATRPAPVVFIDEVPRTPVAVVATASMATSPMPATPSAESASVTTATAMTMTSPKTPMAMPTNVDVADGSRLAAHLESVTISNELLRDGNRSLQREVDRLRSELEAAATTSDKELREAQDALAGLGTELAELQKAAAAERAELAATAARLEQTQAEAAEWEVEAADMASIKVQQAELEAELEAATAALAAAETRAEQLAAQVTSTSSAGDAERVALSRRAEAAEAALVHAKADIARLSAEQAEKEVSSISRRVGSAVASVQQHSQILFFSCSGCLEQACATTGGAGWSLAGGSSRSVQQAQERAACAGGRVQAHRL